MLVGSIVAAFHFHYGVLNNNNNDNAAKIFYRVLPSRLASIIGKGSRRGIPKSGTRKANGTRRPDLDPRKAVKPLTRPEILLGAGGARQATLKAIMAARRDRDVAARETGTGYI